MSNVDLFWYWVNERMRIYRKRERGDPWPWTDDLILQRYRFCMPSRDLDKMTLELVASANKVREWERTFRVFVFRYFNRSSTYALIAERFANRSWCVLNVRKELRTIKGPVITGVWQVPGLISGAPVWEGSVRSLDRIFSDIDTIHECISNKPLSHVYHVVLQQPMAGKFLSYQIAQDLLRCHPRLIIDDGFYQLGPGAQRGLRLLPRSATVESLRDAARQYVEDRQLRARFNVSDVEHSLCEFDKYHRAKHGAKLRNRYHHK